jgi:hypothetical protein
VKSSCEYGNKPSDSIEFRKSTEWLHNWWDVEIMSFFIELVG